MYNQSVKPMVQAFFNKARVTIFAYGQTGSGKTFTMMGTQDGKVPGLYLLASFDICNYLS
jgi:kinesin family protein 2/24